MTTVLIADTQTLQRLGLRMLTEAEPDLTVVGEATTGTEAVRRTAELRPDVVLMDARMPGPDGLDGVAATRRIVRAGGPSRVLILTAAEHERDGCTALRAGADGLLLNDARPHELTAAIRAVAAGGSVIAPRVTRRLIESVRDRRIGPTTEHAHQLAALTDRERDVLGALAHGWSNAEIAERLSIAPTTVKSHVSRILTKIGAHARVQAVSFAYDSGLVRPTAAGLRERLSA